MSSKKLYHCSAVKLGGVLEVGALTVCNFAVFFCMEFIVLCGFSHDSVLFHLGKPKGHLQCGFASLLSVSVKNPVLRDTLSSLSGWDEAPRGDEEEQLTRSDFRSFDMRLDRVISEASMALEIPLDKLNFGDSLGSEGSGS